MPQLPLPRKPRFIGRPRRPPACGGDSRRRECRWWQTCRRRPGAAAQHGRDARWRAPRSICCGQMKWMCVSMPPAVMMQPSPAMTSVAAPIDHRFFCPRVGSSRPAWSGLPGVPDADDVPVLDADVGLDDPEPRIKDQRVGNDQIKALGVEGGRGLAHAVADDFAAAKLDLVAVSPPSAMRSRSTWTNRSVSARRTRSPTVGPNISAYCRRESVRYSISDFGLDLECELGCEIIGFFLIS